MGNGPNESVEFTRADAERIQAIELRQKVGNESLNKLIKRFDSFITLQHTERTVLNKQVNKNSRFRRNTVKVLLWLLTTCTGSSLLAIGAKAMGWLN